MLVCPLFRSLTVSFVVDFVRVSPFCLLVPRCPPRRGAFREDHVGPLVPLPHFSLFSWVLRWGSRPIFFRSLLKRIILWGRALGSPPSTSERFGRTITTLLSRLCRPARFFRISGISSFLSSGVISSFRPFCAPSETYSGSGCTGEARVRCDGPLFPSLCLFIPDALKVKK